MVVVRSPIASRIHASSPVVVVLAIHLIIIRKLDKSEREGVVTHQSRVGQHGLVSLVVSLHVVSSVVKRDGHVGRPGLVATTGTGHPAYLAHLLAGVLRGHVRIARRQTQV